LLQIFYLLRIRTRLNLGQGTYSLVQSPSCFNEQKQRAFPSLRLSKEEKIIKLKIKIIS